MLVLEQDHLDDIIAHSRQEWPDEACGLIAGVGGRSVKVYRGTNVSEAKRVKYTIDPADIFVAMKEMDKRDWELLAIYHSHPHTRAYPSPTDISLACYPDAHFVIVSLMDRENPEVRAFRIVAGEVSEVGLEIARADERAALGDKSGR